MFLSLPLVGMLCVAGIVVGILGDRLWLRYGRRSMSTTTAANPIPVALSGLPSGHKDLIELLQREWQTNISVQMHFNDLIIKFRSMTLAAFAALFGAALAVANALTLSPKVKGVVLVLPVGFWVAAGFLDLGYYHRLLLGAVSQAAKFDDHDGLRELGLFGLTTTIKKTVRPFSAQVFVVLYYLLPMIAVVGLTVWVSQP